METIVRVVISAKRHPNIGTRPSRIFKLLGPVLSNSKFQIRFKGNLTCASLSSESLTPLNSMRNRYSSPLKFSNYIKNLIGNRAICIDVILTIARKFAMQYFTRTAISNPPRASRNVEYELTKLENFTSLSTAG